MSQRVQITLDGKAIFDGEVTDVQVSNSFFNSDSSHWGAPSNVTTIVLTHAALSPLLAPESYQPFAEFFEEAKEEKEDKNDPDEPEAVHSPTWW